MASSQIKLAVIGGDGIGPEVVAEALKVLKATGLSFDETSYDLCAHRWHRTAETLPDSVLEEIRARKYAECRGLRERRGAQPRAGEARARLGPGA